MSDALRLLRMFLHAPGGGGRRAIGHLSRYGDVVRVTFEASYVHDPSRPTLSLSYRGEDEAATRAILGAPYDARLARSDGRVPVYFENLLPEGHNRERLAAARGCEPDDGFELLAAAGHDLMGALEFEAAPSSEAVPEAGRAWHRALALDGDGVEATAPPTEDAASLRWCGHEVLGRPRRFVLGMMFAPRA